MKHLRISTSVFVSAIIVMVFAALMPATALAKPQECKIVNQSSDEKFDSLQAAVDVANPGDSMTLKGTCVGATFIAKDLTIRGHSNPAFGIATLDGTGAGAPVLRLNGGNITLEGLTITGGTGFDPVGNGNGIGGGILSFFSTLTLDDMTISDNNAGGGGGGIFALGTTLVLNNSTVSSNTANNGGGIVVSCGFAGGSFTMNNSSVTDNHSSSLGVASGGGIFSQSCVVTLNNSAVTYNTSSASGGGIAPFNGALFLNNSTIRNNTAVVSGGGLYALNNPVTLDASSTISDNTPDNCAGNTCP